MKKSNNKGFTLVELIVVLVILAILAAILVPALLGYIDKAREGQYAEEAHSIMVAAQAYETEQYAKDGEFVETFSTSDKSLDYVNKIVDPTIVKSLKVTNKGAGSHEKFTVNTVEVEFKSQNGKTGKMEFDGGEWTIKSQFE